MTTLSNQITIECTPLVRRRTVAHATLGTGKGRSYDHDHEERTVSRQRTPRTTRNDDGSTKNGAAGRRRGSGRDGAFEPRSIARWRAERNPNAAGRTNPRRDRATPSFFPPVAVGCCVLCFMLQRPSAVRSFSLLACPAFGLSVFHFASDRRDVVPGPFGSGLGLHRGPPLSPSLCRSRWSEGRS